MGFYGLLWDSMGFYGLLDRGTDGRSDGGRNGHTDGIVSDWKSVRLKECENERV